MRIIEKEKKTEIIDVTKDILCNKCGKSAVSFEAFGEKLPEGTHIYASFEYGSNKDGLYEEFDLCDDCYDKIVNTFKHKPEEII